MLVTVFFALTKMPDKDGLREKHLFWLTLWKDSPSRWGDRLEEDGHLTSVDRKKNVRGMLILSSLSFFFSVQNPSSWGCGPYLGWAFSLQLNFSRKPLWTQLEVCPWRSWVQQTWQSILAIASSTPMSTWNPNTSLKITTFYPHVGSWSSRNS